MNRPAPVFGIAFRAFFVAVCLLTVASFVIAVLHVNLAGMIVYDYNSQAMHETLSPHQAAGIVRTVKNLTAWSIWPLFASNLCWIALFVVSYSRITRDKEPSA